MNKINRKLEYSLIALKHLSAKNGGELSTAKEISEKYGSPFDATAKVLQVMAAKGWVKSEHGAAGGYSLACDLAKVDMNSLIEVIEGPTQIAKCLHDTCEIQKNCNISSPMERLNTKLMEFYRNVNLHDLLLGS